MRRGRTDIPAHSVFLIQKHYKYTFILVPVKHLAKRRWEDSNRELVMIKTAAYIAKQEGGVLGLEQTSRS